MCCRTSLKLRTIGLGSGCTYMNIEKVIGDLRAYREQIDQAIVALESLARRREKKRGRPPKWMSEAPAQTRTFSEATKKKMAASQKKRWAAARKKKPAEA